MKYGTININKTEDGYVANGGMSLSRGKDRQLYMILRARNFKRKGHNKTFRYALPCIIKIYTIVGLYSLKLDKLAGRLNKE